jgi:hypothetical protein
MKTIKIVTILIFITLFFSRALAHDIDHLSNQLGVKPIPKGQPKPTHHQVYPDDPLSWDGVFYEGQPTNTCLESEEKYGPTGRTMRQINHDFWHSRRNLINMVTYLSGFVNRNYAYAISEGKPNAKIPFYNYDPFKNCFEPYYTQLPGIFALYAPSWGLPQYYCDGLEVRYDHFLKAQMDHPEHSYRVDFPARGESAFNYYDRIPANPVADACMWWKEGRITFQHALSYAEAHREAGIQHHNALKARVLYIWSLEFIKKYVP